MKTIKYFTYRIMAVAAIAIAFALPAKAQITPMTYFNVDWQFSAPIPLQLLRPMPERLLLR